MGRPVPDHPRRSLLRPRIPPSFRHHSTARTNSRAISQSLDPRFWPAPLESSASRVGRSELGCSLSSTSRRGTTASAPRRSGLTSLSSTGILRAASRCAFTCFGGPERSSSDASHSRRTACSVVVTDEPRRALTDLAERICRWAGADVSEQGPAGVAPCLCGDRSMTWPTICQRLASDSPSAR